MSSSPAHGHARFCRKACLAAAALGASLLGGCELGQQAHVTVSYDSTRTDAPLVEQVRRERVEKVFGEFAERNGYKCRPDVKRVDIQRCQGPKGLHLVFEPSLNEHEFVAKFSWANLSDRTKEEFRVHVKDFEQQMGAALGERDVRMSRER